jgi:hypothetical protein
MMGGGGETDHYMKIVFVELFICMYNLGINNNAEVKLCEKM